MRKEEARGEEAEGNLRGRGIWKVTKGAEDVRREIEAARERRDEIVMGLERCTVCGKEAKAVEFGAEGHGVWIGCDRTGECSRYIEMHTEGWSLEEVAAEWNRYNSGMFRVIRKVKRWLILHFGANKRAKEREKEQKKAEIEAERAKREDVFGIKRVNNKGKWWKIWRKGNK